MNHGFHYSPGDNAIRFTDEETVRTEIMERLLLLNQKRCEEQKNLSEQAFLKQCCK